MHLLKFDSCGELSLTKDLIEDIPSYAILSHTWGADEDEVTFQDLADGSAQSKPGYAKVRSCGEQARRDGLQHFWVDTCCIDKTSHVMLSEAIASMFRWYRDAAKCYVYLSDVAGPNDDRPETRSTYEAEFRRSRYHTRGWTLQELLAPTSVEFFSCAWTFLGDKSTLDQQIHEATQIPIAALRGKPLNDFSVDERMRWAVNRSTRRKEDKAYSLMGIFNVFIPLIYGEGDNAFFRLKDEIDRAIRAKSQPLDVVWQRAREPAARIGLVGLGGVGKSQLAIEYAYRVREANPMTWVFWVHASSAARFEESYKKIAERIKLSGWNEPKADILGMVCAWLSDENNGHWTMVVDNADSPRVMFEPCDGAACIPSQSKMNSSSNSHSLADYLPSASTGSILITSRSREVTAGLIEYDEDILDVGPMDEETAVVLLRAKLKKDDRSIVHDLVELVRQLEYMPLAISQAAAYINQRGSRITLSAYLNTLTRTDNDRAQLLQIDIRDPRRDGQASNSIVATWHISFEHIRQTRDSAARLLALMSLFDRQAIPDHLLRENYTKDGQGHIDFEEDIASLRAYHLIGFGANNNLFNMHRLVQFSTRKWLELHAELDKWQAQYLDVLLKWFPECDHTNWRTCQPLFSHVEALLTYRGSNTNYLEAWATVLRRGSFYAYVRGQYGTAKKMAEASLQGLEEVSGVDHWKTFSGLNLLASILHRMGKYDEAESMHRRSLTGCEEAYGANHRRTLRCSHDLAKVLHFQGKYDEAELILRHILGTTDEMLEIKPCDRLAIMGILAMILRKQGKYDEAESMIRVVVDGNQSALGKDHPNTSTSIHILAKVLHKQKKYSEAETMFRQALVGCKAGLGEEHPITLTTMHNLAVLLDDQGEYNEAEPLYKRAIAGSKDVLGKDHPATLARFKHLVAMLREQGKYDEAETVRQQAEMWFI
ncbi:hypothetical protein H2200_000713 [Cladophialophora chaetospira]|uniref:Heterokaryon incompatibility domain-containing protein n=1 Tax=Cladophialophora chaetospira TaxID=386627 RepID=A0AA39CQL0_9EURO|nr:hypothetical protein H2200_000713 [Cladophialophora chaetospira]